MAHTGQSQSACVAYKGDSQMCPLGAQKRMTQHLQGAKRQVSECLHGALKRITQHLRGAGR